MVGEEALVLDRTSNQVHQLNVTATFIWLRCDGVHTVERIAEELAAAFAVDAATAQGSVEDALREFGRLGLLGSDGG